MNKPTIWARCLAGCKWPAAHEEHEHSADDIKSGVLTVERGGTGATTPEEAVRNLGINVTGAKITVGEYSGTGGTTKTLTFDFVPKIVFISCSSASFPSTRLINGCKSAQVLQGALDSKSTSLTWSENSVMFTTDNNNNLNDSGDTFRYCAIG